MSFKKAIVTLNIEPIIDAKIKPISRKTAISSIDVVNIILPPKLNCFHLFNKPL